ncbi:MAG: GDSL-type esterase/lipase family protein [Planctomycetaceae bacterium]|nr:GDSL-type esterase/lipase family protein [Planctomycetaceae bacterium]
MRLSLTGAVLLVATFLPCLGRPVVRADETQSAGVWLRQVIDLRQVSGDCRLMMVGRGTADVYFNGQKLARDVNVDTPVAWDVSPLLRGQRNCIALQLQATDESATQVALQSQGQWVTVPPSWKRAPEAPPVGWQTTDFNDRDWKPDTKLVTSGGDRFSGADMKDREWRSAQAVARRVDGRLQLQPDDHVVMLGGTFVERAQAFGYLELALKIRSPQGTTFRNLGWSGDTVFADSRGIFDPVEKGYERMIEHVRAEEPDVILVCYGQNEAMSFAGDQGGLARLASQLDRLVTDLQTTGAEVVLISPHPFLSVERPYPSPDRWNDRLESVVSLEKSLARRRQLLFVDLFEDFVADMKSVAPVGSRLLADYADHPDLESVQLDEWSDNGMHWTAEGYRRAACVLSDRLFGPGEDIDVKAALDGEAISPSLSVPAKDMPLLLEPVEVEIALTSEQLPAVTAESSTGRTVSVPLELSSRDGRLIATGRVNPAADQVRELIIRKNELYFHRWRPQNITYLFGFRKHEQGNNAREIAQFDPLVEELEVKIDELCRPYTLTISVRPASEEGDIE